MVGSSPDTLYRPVEKEESGSFALETDTLSSSTDEEDPISDANATVDEIAALVRNTTPRIGLISIYGICIIMAVVSVVLGQEFDSKVSRAAALTPISTNSAATNVSSYEQDGGPDHTCPSELNTVSPVWFVVLSGQLPIIKNLIHASLLGTTATLAALRGDAVWLFATRNVAFFFGLVSFSYTCVDVHAVLYQNATVTWRLCLAVGMALFCSVALIQYHKIHTAVRRLSVQGDATGPGVAMTEYDILRTRYIEFAVSLVQVIAVLYTVCTTGSWIQQQEEVPDLSLRSFEDAYSLAAHQAYLLALLNLVTVLPRDSACIGGALLVSGWRSVAASTSLLNSLCIADHSFKSTASVLSLAIEATIMIPVFCLSASLANGYMQFTAGELSGKSCRTSMHEVPTSVLTYRCPTTFDMVSSVRLSPRQRVGAGLLSYGSMFLFLGMTGECMVMLHPFSLGSPGSHEVYLWGMHVCSMFVFVVSISVSNATVFYYTRFLLLVMSPVGSAIAIWQLYMLQQYCGSKTDHWHSLTIFLLICRALCGLSQSIGLLLLDEVCFDSTTDMTRESSQKDPERSTCLNKELTNSRVALYGVYLPCFAVYLICNLLLNRCVVPMIPQNTEATEDAPNMFVLAQKWPGLGIFFHYGLLTVIFGADAISPSVPSMRQSLVITVLFSGHIAWLLSWQLFTGMPTFNADQLSVFHASIFLFAGSSLNLFWRLCRLKRFREA